MAFCLPQFQVKKFIDALKNGVVEPTKLVDMSSADRRAFLSNIVGEADAKEVNALFESKLLLKNQQRGMINWAKKVGGLTEPARRDLISRISRMDKVLTAADQKSFLSDLAEKKLKTEVTFEEAQKIVSLSKAVEKAKNEAVPNFAGVSDEYLKAKNDLLNYLESVKPTSAPIAIGKDLVTIGRNNLLLAPSTLIKTSIGQFMNSAIDAITRRLSTLSLRGDNSDLVSQAVKEARQTSLKTGVGVTAMEGLSDTRVLGEKGSFSSPRGETVGGKVISAVEGGIRKVAQASNKVAIDWQHRIPFNEVHARAFYDMTNILTSDIAKKEGLTGAEAKARSAEIFRDASQVEPQTDLGKMVRSRAQEGAARVTNTNDTWASRISLGIKSALNKAGEPAGVPLGNLLEPIAKIPASIFANAVENAGVGLITGAKDVFQGYKDMQSDNLTVKYQGMVQLQKGYQTLGRTVGLMGLAIYLGNQFSSKDFRTDAYGNHFVRLGDTWVNTEYIAWVSPALAGVMRTKEGKNNGMLDTLSKYSAGVLAGAPSVPGAGEVYQFAQALGQTGTRGAEDYLKKLVTDRALPAGLADMWKTRPVNRLFFGSSGLESTEDVRADDRAKAVKAAETRRINARNK